MFSLIRNIIAILLLMLIVCAEDATACPMCKTAAESAAEASQQPTAYMVSILAMLSMPTILFAALGVTMYRISRSETEMLDSPDISGETLS